MPRGTIKCRGCNRCGPPAKKKWDGHPVEIKGKVKDHNDLLDLKPDGTEGNETRWCPPTNVLPTDAPAVDANKKPEPPAPPPAPKKAPPRYVDFGYGPACEHCRATKGEGHGLGCPHYEECHGKS